MAETSERAHEAYKGCGCEHEGCGCEHDHHGGQGHDGCHGQGDGRRDCEHESHGCGGHEGCGCEHDQVAMFIVGPIETNCYVYISEGECMVVDPGNSGAKIAEHLPDGVTVKYIAATHGHGDHVGGVKALKEAVGGSYVIHPADVELAKHAGEPSELGYSYDDNAPDPDLTYTEGDVIEVGGASFRVIETPGHTPGSICLVGEGSAAGLCFTGDTVFQGSCGRTDLAGGNPKEMRASLARVKREIDPHTTLFCGHGEITTMEDELVSNPYFQ